MTKPELKRVLWVFNMEIAVSECENTLLHASLDESTKLCCINLD